MSTAARAKKTARVIGRTVVALVAVTTLAVSGYFWTALRLVKENTNTTQILQVLEDIPNSPPAEDGAIDILLVGSDSRTDAQGNRLHGQSGEPVLFEQLTCCSDDRIERGPVRCRHALSIAIDFSHHG